MKRRLMRWIPLVLLAGAISLRFAQPPALEEAQLKVFDGFQRLAPRPYENVPVRIVDLDDESLAKMGQWPWPRTLVARMIDRLTALGVSVIAFDIVFAEPDRTSPANILAIWPSTPEIEALRANIKNLPDHDRLLAESMAKTRVIAGFALTGDKNNTDPVIKAGFAYAGDAPDRYLVPFEGAVANLPDLEKAAAGNGSFTILAEQDGIIRRVPLLFSLRGTLRPSLAAEALRVAQGAATYLVKSSGASGEMGFGAHTGMVGLKIGSFFAPTDAEGRLWLYETGPVKERWIPAWRLFSEELKPGALDGMIVYIGTSAAGLKDLRATPLNPVAAGVEVHAQLTEQVLLQKFLIRPDWAPGAEILFLLIFGLFLVFFLPRAGAAWCALLGLAALTAVFGLSWYAFRHFHWLLDPVFPSVAALVIYLVSSLIHFLETEASRREIHTAFSRYLSPALVDQVARNPSLLKLGGERKNMTILFADIRHFTAIAEQFDAEGLTRLINRFLTPMTELILKTGGTIDKYMGDCVMAFWNAPLDDEAHAAHAGQAALNMREYLVEWNKQLKKEAEEERKPVFSIHVGIGINTGDCCVGNMGSDQRFDYSVIGNEVNLASRFEGQCKTYGVDIMVGEHTHEQLQDYATLELDLIQVMGKTKPARIFALLGDHLLKKDDTFLSLKASHQAMIAAYRSRQWDKAASLIEECLRLDTPRTRLKGLYQLFRERIDDYRVHPPALDWGGVFIAESK